MGDYALFNDEKQKGVKKVKHLRLIFGSGEALEPFYYRVLYALRNNRFYQVIKKIKDYYNIGPNTQQFGFATSNLRQEISSATGLLGQIGQVVKSIVGMRKDKQRIDECLKYYDSKGKPDELVLKGLWADFVDSKTGPASLTQAAQKLEYFVARDWFFVVNSSKEALELKDVPKNVKTFLAKKYREYEVWKKEWKSRLEEMQGILDQQIKASKQTVNLYKKWVEPLLNNVEALKLAPKKLNPDLIKIGGSTYSQVEIVCWHKVQPRHANRVSFTYIEGKKHADKDMGEKGTIKVHGKDSPFMPLIHIVFTLRAGKDGKTETIVDFYGELYDKKKFEEDYWDDWNKDPVDEWVDNLMLNQELPIKLEEEAGKEKKKDFLSIVGDRLDKFSESITNFTSRFKFKKIKKSLKPFDVKKLEGDAAKELKKDVGTIYYVVKKSFDMLADLEMSI